MGITELYLPTGKHPVGRRTQCLGQSKTQVNTHMPALLFTIKLSKFEEKIVTWIFFQSFETFAGIIRKAAEQIFDGIHSAGDGKMFLIKWVLWINKLETKKINFYNLTDHRWAGLIWDCSWNSYTSKRPNHNWWFTKHWVIYAWHTNFSI